ncbi:hypothetical protein HPQ64_11535 [Rhizobiales bacterium]|uniref:SGNH/GDSL hydrolase family protein n=1 Tax=Hongsoonwoonella zoysiae TaxID=2821844 RepID=UPI001560A3C9|nr:SGNH/GDSL hydrolase family protein [Hongsoonwoonella zoysiae]NRG18321.1 hypothetical protein [Hongsoonwoonella zoysiae]
MSNKSAEIFKISFFNIFLLLALITLGNVLAVIVINQYNANKTKQYAESHLFPNYEGVDWARKHFEEYDNLTKGYFASFVGWRRPPYSGETINIDENGLRRTVGLEDADPQKTIALYGGSTMWGTGANDETTIPSYVAQKSPNLKAYNFGETGYISHQSFNRFFESYSAGFRPDIVVFYDGVNDVWNRCRREHGSYSHAREQEIRTFLANRREASFMDVVGPMNDLAGRVKRTLASRKRVAEGPYDCQEDPEKAERIARNLLYDWRLMKDLVEGYGGQFVAILQPHAYISKSRIDYLSLDPRLGEEYAAVYPRVVDLIATEFQDLQKNFLDLRTALDRDEAFYIDWCHLSPNGNEIIASHIVERLDQEGSSKSTKLLTPAVNGSSE